MFKLGVIAVLVLLASGTSAAAKASDQGQAICYEVQNAVNALVDYTTTKCLPITEKSGVLSFMVISSKPVFSAPAAQKGWVLVVVSALGKSLNDRGTIKTNELWLSDVSNTQQHTAYILPVSLAKSLQSKVYHNKISLSAMYSTITEHLHKRHVQR